MTVKVVYHFAGFLRCLGCITLQVWGRVTDGTAVEAWLIGGLATLISVTADELLFRRRTSDCLDLSYLGVSC